MGIEYDKITSESPEIIDEIILFVKNLEENEQIGKKTGFNEWLETLKEGELRYRFKIPPGFNDDNKCGVEKFGDLFIWKEILKLPTIRNVRHVIFITNDEKDDWWTKDKKGNLAIHSSLIEEFSQINPYTSIDFMTIEIFQKYASKLYSLCEFGVYADFNRKDEEFIERINDKIVEDIIREVNCYEDYYLFSNDIGSEGIEDIEFLECSFNRIEETYSEISDSDIIIYYDLLYSIEISCISHDYWGRDDETKQIILSPDIKHSFEGDIIVSINRTINKNDVEKQPNMLKEDEEYMFEDIIRSNIEQVDRIDAIL